MSMIRRCVAVLVALALTTAPAWAQQVINNPTIVGGTLQGSRAVVSFTIPAVSVDPATCNVGQIILNTTVPALKSCTATNTWTAAGGGGSLTFTNITSGTNITAAMVVGSGASLTYLGSGVIDATTVNGNTLPALGSLTQGGLIWVDTATGSGHLSSSAALTGVLKGTGTTAPTTAAAATDYVAPSAYASANGLTMATARILGRTTAGSGAAEELTCGTGLTCSGGTITASGGSPAGSTGDLQTNAGGGVFGGYAGTSPSACSNQFLTRVVISSAGVITATCATVDLTAAVTGALPIGNGGTGQTTQPAAIQALHGVSGVYNNWNTPGGTITGDTSLHTLIATQLPVMAANDVMNCHARLIMAGANGNRTYSIYFDTTSSGASGTQLWTTAYSNAQTTVDLRFNLANVNSTSSQVFEGWTINTSNSVNLLSQGTSAKSTTGGPWLTITGQLVNSADSISIRGMDCQLTSTGS